MWIDLDFRSSTTCLRSTGWIHATRNGSPCHQYCRGRALLLWASNEYVSCSHPCALSVSNRSSQITPIEQVDLPTQWWPTETCLIRHCSSTRAKVTHLRYDVKGFLYSLSLALESNQSRSLPFSPLDEPTVGVDPLLRRK